MAPVQRPPSVPADVERLAQSEHALRRRRVAAVAFVLAALVTLAGPAAADPPTLRNAPSDITVEAAGPTGAPVSFDLSSLATDDNGAPSIVCSPESGSLFAIGSTPVSCTLTDQLTTETTSASFHVIVRDTTPPTITVPASVTASATGPNGATVSFTVMATDLVDGSVPVACTPASGSMFPLGKTNVSCSAHDAANNAASATFTVAVQDTTLPVITVPGPITAEATSSNGATMDFAVTAKDSVDPAPAVTCTPASGSSFPVGKTPVSCTARDASGNASAPQGFTVTVQDTTPPVITVPAPITAEATSSQGATVSFTATATDLVDGAVAVACSPAAGSIFPLGKTSVSCSAHDAANNAAGGTFTVTVQDTTAPVITVPAPITVTATGPDGAVVTYTVSATDLVDGPVPVACTPASGSIFPLGKTTVSCSAQDSQNHSGTDTFTVTVEDTTPPVITVPAPITVTATGANGAVATFAATATDAVEGPLAVACTPASGSTFPLGQTTVSCRAEDSSHNSTARTFTVTVVDTLPPLLHVPGTIQATGPAGAVVTFSVTATDSVDGAVTPTCSPASGATFPLGQTTVTCSAQDAHGNKASQSFLVSVTAAPPPPAPDRTPPVITVPSPISTQAEGPPGTVVAFTATAVDAVDGSVPATCSPASGSVFSVGRTTVRCSGQDAHGNSATKTFTVTVIDKTPPPAVVGLTVQARSGHTLLRWQNPRSDDLNHVELKRTRLPGGSTVILYHGTGTSYTDLHAQNGVRYQYTVFAVDASGNRSGLAMIVEPTALVLVHPADGARVSHPPVLLWVPAAHADYYNVQLYRNGLKVLSAWPTTNRYALLHAWAFAGQARSLSPGVYRWYVWPGYGPTRSRKFGALIGTSTFQVTG